MSSDSSSSLPSQIWVDYNGNEWEFSSQISTSDKESCTVRKVLLLALDVFRLDAIAEPLTRLSYKGEIQPLRKSLLEFDTDTLEFELVRAHTAQDEAVYQTRYFSPLHSPEEDKDPDMSELIYLYDEDRLATNVMLVQELAHQASNKEYRPVIGVLGNTGTGKSLLLTSLLDRKTQIPHIRAIDQQGSTTANVNIYRKEKGDYPCVYLDFEGENGTSPQNIRHSKFWRIGDESTRRNAVRKFFPKLSYILCDVILFCTTDELSADFSVYDRCLEFAQRANVHLKETDRPALIIIHNKFIVSLENFQSELEVENSTEQFLQTFDKDNQLRGFFSSCKVVRLPLLSEVHDSSLLRSLWDQQIDRTMKTINSLSSDRYESRKEFGYQLTQTSWFKILPRVVVDICSKKKLSLARYLLDLRHAQMEDQISFVCDIFRCLFESKEDRSVNWYRKCTSIAVDTLARSWGTAQYEQGLLLDEKTIEQADVLQHLLEYLDQVKPCTATLTKHKRSYQCNQARALHDHHRTVTKNLGIKGKVLGILGSNKKTVTWEGEFECSYDDDAKRKLNFQFQDHALAYAQQDEDKIGVIFEDVFQSEVYRTTIWEMLMNFNISNSGDRNIPSLNRWAKELTQYCMKTMNLKSSANLWDLATTNWNYLNLLCQNIPLASIKLSDEFLGKGEFGCVYRGSFIGEKGKEIDCAVKVIDDNSPVFHLDGLRQEIVILSVVTHPRLVKFFGYAYSNETSSFYLVQHRMAMNLLNWIETTSCPTLSQIVRIISDIAEGITVLHSFNVAHRDLAPGNILMQHDGEAWRACVADLGIARKVSVDNPMTRIAPKQDFCAPELLEDPNKCECFYSLSIDVFSFGKLVKLLLDTLDYSNSTITQLHLLVAQCTQKDPDRRPPVVANFACIQEIVNEITRINSLLAQSDILS